MAQIPFLLALDFDCTVIEDNSDQVVQDLKRSGPLPDEVTNKRARGAWNKFMATVFEYHHSKGVQKEDYDEVLDAIPFVPGMLDLIKEAKQMGAELIICSDANQYFIDRILETNFLTDHFSSIFTNPGAFNEEGLLVLKPFHSNTWCELSPSNMCKGTVLSEYIEKRRAEGTTFGFVAYAGDGSNDFCPMAALGQNDLAFPRSGFSICRVIGEMDQRGRGLKCEKVGWINGKDVLEAIKRKFAVQSGGNGCDK
jgi:2,3-diketo-5-methylthio-1-phosphopentane phosphatase